MTEQVTSKTSAIDPSMIDAFMKTSQTAMKGFERLSQYFFESTQRNFQYAIDTNKRLSGVKSLNELADLQTKLSQEFFDYISESNKAGAELTTSIRHDVAVSAPASGGLNRKVSSVRAA